MRKKSELVLNLLLLPIDFVAILSAFVLAYILRVKIDGRPVAYPVSALLYLKIFLLIVPVWIAIFGLVGLYISQTLRRGLIELSKIIVATAGGTMSLILLDFFSRQPLFPSKTIPIYGFAFSLILVFLGRQFMRWLRRFLFRYGIGIRYVVIVGSGEIAQKIIKELTSNARTGYKVVAAIDDATGAAKRLGGIKVYKGLKDFVASYKGKDIDEIIQADSGLDHNAIIDIVNFTANNHILYRFVPNQFGLYATNAQFSTIGGLSIIEMRKTPLDGWGRIIKRMFDITGSLLGLVILSPVFVIVALLVKISDWGPVFYRHKRLSRSGQQVYIYKFRSMYTKYSTGVDYNGMTDDEVLGKVLGKPELIKEFHATQKLKNDPRVTPLGRFLRNSSLDELPQLANVLMGQLSLVGPRPVVIEELEHYGAHAAMFLALKPGLTGLWQISGRNDISYDERVKLDIYYVENWSLLLDIQILFKTIGAVLRGGGGY